MTTLTFTATHAQVDSLLESLKSDSAVILAGAGGWYITTHGFRCTASFDGNTLTVTVDKAPWPAFISVAKLKAGIQNKLSEGQHE